MAKITDIENFAGGLSLVNPRNIEDNEFEELTNMFYNSDKRIQSRRGIDFFGNALANGDPVTSLFFFQNDITAERVLLAISGTEIYRYNEGTSDYDELKTGLTEFEADGVTRTRWSFAVYKNEVFMCNGIDNYQKLISPYGSGDFTEYAAQPKPRYLEYMQDSIFAAGIDATPSTLNYTAAGAIDGSLIDTNLVVVGGDELGRINGIKELGKIILAGKNDKIYSINIANETAEPIDSQNGLYSDRAIKRVGGSLAYFNDTGYDFLKQRSGVTGSQGLESESKTADLSVLTSKITPNSYNYSYSEYIGALKNLYWTFDTSDNKTPDTTLVWSTLVGSWSQYILPNSNDSAQYIDEDGVVHYLIASGTEGRVYEFETGFNDFGIAIPTSLTTKEWDFGDITRFDTFEYLDIVGLKSEGGEINVDVLVGGESVGASILDDTYINKDRVLFTIGSQPIGTRVIGGGAGLDEVDLYQYKIRIPLMDTDTTIQLKMNSEDIGLIWTLDKVAIASEKESDDMFEFNLIG